MNNPLPKLSYLFILFFIVQIIISISCSEKIKELGAPNNLCVEYQHNPLGIDILKPRLFWEVNDSRRGAFQSAYQIIVASSLKKIKSNIGDVWDSGKIKSDKSSHVVYSGKALESQKQYFWKVKTWDMSDISSPFSDVAKWEMGILKKNEWSAQWISNQIIEKQNENINKWKWTEWFWHPSEIRVNVPVYFRKKVSIPTIKKVKSAVMRLTADNKFTAIFNNKEIGSGSSWQKIYDFTVTELITKNNIIAIKATNTAGNICGLLFSLKIIFEDNSEIYIGADKNTKGWKTSSKLSKEWNKYSFNDSKWQKIKHLGDYESGAWEQIDEKDKYYATRPILVRNEFNISKEIKSARAYITGLGGYVAQINGKRVGDLVFTPGWTHYPKRIQYQTYDVTKLLQEGNNAIGAILGNLWWSSGLGWRGSKVYSKGALRFMMQLRIDYEDGSNKIIVSNGNWKTKNAPLISSTIYHGETYDARLEESGWSKAEFDDSKWKSVNIQNETGKLVAQQGPPLRAKKELKPTKITSPSKDVYVFDMGQNFAGWVKLKVEGEKGEQITMRFAETLKPDGNVYRDNLRQAEATDRYILKGEGLEEWQPHFTYHGFRYVEVTGLSEEPTKDLLTGIVVYSDAPFKGEFSCSNDLINKIQKNIQWGQISNMHSVPTDCPQRDERLGWMGDAQAFAPTASYNMEMIGFFNKWMNDITDSQHPDGAVCDVNPVIVVEGPAAPGWGDAVYIVPWEMYKFFGDKRILEENYSSIVRWVEYMRSKSKNNLYETNGYGDWVAVEKSPTKPIGSAYYYYGTKITSEIAKILGYEDDNKKYEDLANKIATAYNKKHYDLKKQSYSGDTQAANLLPLNFGIVPKHNKKEVVNNIVENVLDHNTHLTTGFLGTPYLLPTLSDYGYDSLAYELAKQTTFPSWGYMVEKGATTIWELWDSDSKGPDMNSRNHFALGSCGEWYYSNLAGIKPIVKNPGFKKFIIAPKTISDLKWVEATVNTTFGEIVSYWKKNGKTTLFDFTIPANTEAEFIVPNDVNNINSIYENSKIIYNNESFQSSRNIAGKLNGNKLILDLKAGHYIFEVSYN